MDLFSCVIFEMYYHYKLKKYLKKKTLFLLAEKTNVSATGIPEQDISINGVSCCVILD